MKKSLLNLITAIKNDSFPIILIGPSPSGKTTLIERALEILQLKHKYVESTSRINKPLDGRIVHTVLSNMKDIENVKYNRKMIIETSLSVERHFKEGTIIKTHRNDSETDVDFYRFLGRIFYNKLKIEEIEIEGDRLIYSIFSNNNRNTSNNNRSTSSRTDSSNNYRTDNKTSDKTDNKTDNRTDKRRRFLVEDEESSCLNNDTLTGTYINNNNNENSISSFNEDSIFSEELCLEDENQMRNDEQHLRNDEQHSLVISNHIKKLKNFVDEIEIPHKKEKHSISYDISKLEGYIYANFLDFANLEEASRILDSMSLLDSTKTYDSMKTYDTVNIPSCFMVLIKDILNIKGDNKRGFKGFKSNYI